MNNPTQNKMFLLHKHAYKNNSLILTLLSEQAELVRGIYYGGRKKNLSLFTPYWVGYTPRENLNLLTQFDPLSMTMPLQGKSLYCGLYLNELLVKSLRLYTASAKLIEDYHMTIDSLTKTKDVEPLLRQFEKNMVSHLGFALTFDRSSDLLCPIRADAYYRFEPENGFVLLEETDDLRHDKAFLGQHLLSIARSDYQEDKVRRVAKTVMRQMFHYLLQGKEIMSRTLFASSMEEVSV